MLLKLLTMHPTSYKENAVYERHNHPKVIEAIKESHNIMMHYANADEEFQGDAIRDLMRRIAELSKALNYKDGMH